MGVSACLPESKSESDWPHTLTFPGTGRGFFIAEKTVRRSPTKNYRFTVQERFYYRP